MCRNRIIDVGTDPNDYRQLVGRRAVEITPSGREGRKCVIKYVRANAFGKIIFGCSRYDGDFECWREDLRTLVGG